MPKNRSNNFFNLKSNYASYILILIVIRYMFASSLGKISFGVYSMFWLM